MHRAVTAIKKLVFEAVTDMQEPIQKLADHHSTQHTISYNVVQEQMHRPVTAIKNLVFEAVADMQEPIQKLADHHSTQHTIDDNTLRSAAELPAPATPPSAQN
ncbi:hypothetical protein J6590_027952 [Homalodisca vitripennis]|nr:hypothetical protein J6590_027952 [Homalodisca vitripennis]